MSRRTESHTVIQTRNNSHVSRLASFDSLGEAQGHADYLARQPGVSSAIVVNNDGKELYAGRATFCERDLSAEQRKWLDVPLAEFRRKFGGVSNAGEADLCKALRCAPKHLDHHPVRELMAVVGDGYLERWACRWIVESSR